MDELLKFAISTFLGGGVVVAIIAARNERWKFNAQRKAAKEDKDEEKADKTKEFESDIEDLKKTDREQNISVEERFKKLETQIAAQSEALRLILLDRILQFGDYLIEHGEVTFEQRRRFHQMHKCYHDGLDGNGDADIVVQAVDRLPLKHQTEVNGHAD